MAKESRLAEIFRQELKKDKGIMGAFVGAAGGRLKEKYDVRNILPQYGISGAIAQRIFGKPYRAGGGTSNTIRTAGPSSQVSEKGVSEMMTRIDINGRMTAKNTMVMPAMARDMNLMRLNMQKMVKLSGGTPSTKADMFFKRAGDRESAYESAFQKLSPKTQENTATKKEQNTSGLFSGIGGGIVSLFSGVASFFGNISGGLLKGLGTVFSGAGLLGLIALGGIGWLVSQLFHNVDFSSFSQTLKDVAINFTDLFTDKEGVSFSDRWKTFTGSITTVKDKLVEMATAIEHQISNLGQLFNDLGGGLGIFGLLLGARAAAGIASSWSTQLVGLATKNPAALVGILAGVAVGKIMSDYREGKAAHAAAGETMGSNQREAIRNVGGVSGEDNILLREKEKLESRLTELNNYAIEAGKRNGTNRPTYTPEINRQILNTKSEIAKIDTTLRENKTIRDDNERDEGVRRRASYPASTSPQKMDNSYAERISQRESGGNYDAIYGQKGAAKINGKLVSENTIGEVSSWQQTVKKTNKHAAGKYQFIDVAGVAKMAGLSPTDLFNPVNQEKMFSAYTADNARQLKALDLPTTDEYLSMAHAVGAAGTKSLIEAQKNGKGNQNALDILKFSGASATTNPQLNSSVDNVIAKLKSGTGTGHGQTPLSPNPSSGTMLSSLTEFIRDLEKAVIGDTNITYVTNNNVTGKDGEKGTQQQVDSTNPDALNLFLIKALS